MRRQEPRSKETRTRWEAVRGAIHELSEDGEGAPREDVIKRASILASEREESITDTVDEMERRGEVYQVKERLKDTNATLTGEHP